MKKNEQYTVTCIDDTNMGYGIARIDSMVVFVPKALKGETVRIAITKVKKTYAYCRVLDIVAPSKDRCQPVCQKARLCGGCQLQHLSYPAQLTFKHRHLCALFKDIPVYRPIGMEPGLYYRNKAQFPVQIKDNTVHMGFYRTHSNDIVDIDVCPIQDETINRLFRTLKEQLTVELADGLRHILIRHSIHTGQSQVVLIGSKRNRWEPLVDTCVKQFPSITSFVYNHNDRKDNVILGDTYEVLFGHDSITEMCRGYRFQLHFKSFFQVNPIQMERLYQTAYEFARLTKDMTIVDMYAGTGTIGICASAYVKKVIGVEIVQEAVENARKNCAINHVSNCDYACRDATEFTCQMKESKEKVDVVFVDPPRKGMTKQGIQDICIMQPAKIIYISCNPQTLARDLQIYRANGYHCQQIQPVDMFCQTTGMECVSLLIRQNG